MLRAIILGSAAGGGFPQWNSAGPGCLRARAGDPAAPPRSQCGLAVSADGRRWVLLNASPDLRAQILATPALAPAPEQGGIRHSPIAAVVLTGAEVDALTGLLTLRERHPFALYGAAPALAVLRDNPIFRAVDPAIVPRRDLPLDTPLLLRDAAGEALGLTVEAFAVPGKVPLFQEQDGADPGRAEEGEALGLRITAPGASAPLLFIPGCAAVTPALRERLAQGGCLLFDGTLWRDDEMILAGAGPKTAARMGHMAMRDSVAALAGLPLQRRVFIHINNTNPTLLADSPERAALRAAGWEVAEDGMEIAL
ncbi:pyrroloquinoline quinone biosynthesis protein PqqB [Teichococcus oryzae]|uniref:Coenzyme PQQ synthesis protein B n=1 Tax=Teichococcus oryzae TaxID=1608942 RepID=A0A5B2THF9_9PROT|nr:pyrroloquinoline quinone biosynthesis protein PqqB [Pseudoroseomonas oryzae]KAA2213533.1 pyrroloquinoline quinone biosynthesis protein PqqB [Pseudoroseomonas oryzae]